MSYPFDRVGTVSASKLRIGLVGLGDIGVRAHLPAITTEPRATLVAVTDADADRLAAFAPAGVRTSLDAESVFGDPDVDAVVIATPPSATAGLVRTALEAGKYVLAEKPIALSVAEAADVRDAPGAADRLQIGLTYRHHPAVDRLRELIAGRRARATVADPGSDLRRARRPRRRPAGLRAATALARATAPDRLGRRARLRPAQLPARRGTRRDLGLEPSHRPRVRDCERERRRPHLRRRHRGPAGGRLDDAGAAAEPVPRHGPLGRATLDPPTFRLSVELADGTAETLEPPGDKTETCFALQLQRFVGSALSGTPPVPGLAEALASLELAERIADAAGITREVPA